MECFKSNNRILFQLKSNIPPGESVYLTFCSSASPWTRDDPVNPYPDDDLLVSCLLILSVYIC